MHPAAFQWAKQSIPESPGAVLEIGGADRNGSVGNFFDWARSYVCVDASPGPGVDVVAPFIDWSRDIPDETFDLIVCFEVFEHTHDWPEMVTEAWRLLTSGGRFVGTCASGRRPAHSSGGTGDPAEGEYYENVQPGSLVDILRQATFDDYCIDVCRVGMDLRWTATKWLRQGVDWDAGVSTVIMNPNRIAEIISRGDAPR